MSKNKNRNRTSKSVFICASAILSLWLGATWTTNVKADEVDNNQTANIEQTQQNTDSATANTKDKTNATENQVSPLKEDNNSQTSEKAAVKNTTKVVIHYKGDADKWAPYVWGKNPNSNGEQYKWDGKDDDGYNYATITVDNNEQEVGVLIKGKDSWDKDGQGKDRSVTVDDNGKAEVWYKAGSDDSQKVTPKYDSAKINIHYHGGNASSLNYWTDTDQAKKTVDLTKVDDDNAAGNFDLSGTAFHKIYVAPIGSDTETREFTPLPGKDASDIYIVAQDPTAYYTESFALAQESLSSASMESSHVVDVKTGKKMSADDAKNKLQMNGNEIVKVDAIDPDKNGMSKEFKITTSKDLDILNNNQIGINNNFKSIDIGSYVRSDEFDNKYYYGGDDLGATYAKDQTQIKLWAPTAKKVVLNVYYDSLDNSAAPSHTYYMTRGEKGVWSYKLSGDCKGVAYDYKLTFGNGETTQTDDPYSKAVTMNGVRSVIEDVDNIKPDGFSRMPTFSQPTNAIIYETSIRDFTSDKNSDIKDKGKYLGMIESGVTPDGQITGLDYLKRLGVTHVQIMPMYDFASIDESKNDGSYNWGYDPKNYNVPEGSYSSNPNNPTARIMEMKKMIDGFHKAGIRVIMDVVYNHVYSPKDQALQNTVPGYYFEYDKDNNMVADSGCGNDTASERKMMRKYILDSVKYWATNYNIDGFRFDIMSLLDTTTMNDIREELNKIDPGMLLYGEGWDMRSAKREIGAGQYNADKTPSIGFFSDDIRNSVRSDEPNYTPGLVIGNGKEDKYEADAKKFLASYLGGKDLAIPGISWQIHPYQSPSQTINYVACHDNRTLYDLLKWAMPKESEANIIKRDKLATSMIMFAEGVPFIYGGQEALRTKDGNNNSYNASADINKIDWERVAKNKDVVDYVRKLIKVRQDNPALRLNNYNEINKAVKTISAGENGIFAFEYKEDGKKLYIAFNVNDAKADLKNVDLSKADKVLDSDGNVVLGKTTTLMPLSTLVAEISEKTPEVPSIPSDSSDVTIDNNGNGSVEIKNNTDKVLPAVDLVLTHNAYIYAEDGITTFKENGKNIVLKVDESIHALNKAQVFTLNGKKFYKIGENKYVKVNNTLKRKILIHNAFVYTKNGKAIKHGHKHVVLKKRTTILTLDNDSIVTIKGKKFYRIGENKYVKVANVKEIED